MVCGIETDNEGVRGFFDVFDLDFMDKERVFEECIEISPVPTDGERFFLLARLRAKKTEKGIGEPIAEDGQVECLDDVDRLRLIDLWRGFGMEMESCGLGRDMGRTGSGGVGKDGRALLSLICVITTGDISPGGLMGDAAKMVELAECTDSESGVG